MLVRRLRLAFISLLVFFIVLNVTVARASAQGAGETTATVSGTVTDVEGKPVTDATVSLQGPSSLHVRTDVHGAFVIGGVSPGIYRIVVDSKTLGIATRDNVAVTGDINVAISYEVSRTTGLKTIAVVSTSGSANFNITPASTQSISPSQIALGGETSWRRVFEQIPGVTTGGGSDGGAQTSDTLPDGPFFPVELSINGGLPYETASLIDGMPIVNGTLNNVPGSGTDLSVLPMSAFNGADIVRGPGADSPSIIDSIGGSVIFHPATYVASNSLDFSTSSDPYGGFNSTLIAAVRSNRLSVRLSYGVNDSPGPINDSGPSFVYFGNGYLVDGKPFYCTGKCQPYGGLYPTPYADNAYFYNIGNIACCFNFSTAWSSHSGSVSARYDLSSNVSASVFYAGLQSNAGQVGWNRAWNFTPPTGYSGTYAGGLNLLQDAAPGDQDPLQQGQSLLEEKVTAQLGIGVLQVAALQNRSYSSQMIYEPQTVTTHLWGGGAYGTAASNTPVIFNGGLYTITAPFPETYDYWSATSNHDISLSYAFDFGQTGHAGFSYVTQTYDTPEWTDEDFGAPSDSVEYPSSNYFTSDEMRFFVGGQVLKNVSADLSYYTTNVDYHVNDPNDTSHFLDQDFPYAAPRLGVVWRPNAKVAIRAAAGGGFAASPLSDLIGTNGTPTFSSSTGQYSQTLTNVNLKPEASFGFDVGTDVRIMQDGVLSFDVYRTNLYGQVYETTQQQGEFDGEPLYVTQYGNLGLSRYEGLLLDVRRDPPHGVFWRLSGGLTRAYVVSVPAGFYDTATCTLCNNLSVVTGSNFNGSFDTTVPYSQGSGDIGYRWSRRKFAGITANYFGPNNSYYQPAFIEFDANASYPISKYAALLLTFRNVTNVYGEAQQEYSPSSLTGAPTVAGLPYALVREPYGPRALLVTAQFHL